MADVGWVIGKILAVKADPAAVSLPTQNALFKSTGGFPEGKKSGAKGRLPTGAKSWRTLFKE